METPPSTARGRRIVVIVLLRPQSILFARILTLKEAKRVRAAERLRRRKA